MKGEVVDQGTYRQQRVGEFISVLAVVEQDSALVAQVERDLASSRKGRRDRRTLQRQLEEASAQLAKREAMLPADARPLVAAKAIQDAWQARRSQRSHRHPYHDESLWELDQLAPAVVQDAAEATIPALRRRGSVTVYDGWGVKVGDLPSVVALVEDRRVRQVVTREILRLRALVRDSPMLHRESPDGKAMIIEHAATGLRIKCTAQEVGFAAILARADQGVVHRPDRARRFGVPRSRGWAAALPRGRPPLAGPTLAGHLRGQCGHLDPPQPACRGAAPLGAPRLCAVR